MKERQGKLIIANHSQPELPIPAIMNKPVVKLEISTIVNIDQCKSCPNCFAKVPYSDLILVICPKGNAKMKLAKCPNHSIANVILEVLHN